MNTYNFYPEKLVEGRSKGDTGFIVSVILLWGIGIFALFICSQNTGRTLMNADEMYFVKRQLAASCFGLVGLLFFALCPLGVIKKFLAVFCLVSVLLCFLTFIPGVRYERNNAARWIKIWKFTFQPSELIKFALILFLANFFEKYESLKDSEDVTVSPAVFVLVFVVMLIFAQKDFSTGVLVFAVGVIMFMVSGTNIRWLIPFTLLGIPAIILMILIEPYRVARITSYLDPSMDPMGSSFQTNASKRAIVSGGFWGQGIGLDDMNWVPEIQSDYIFSGWTYAMGFVGVLLFFVLMGFFTWRAVSIALRCPNRFGAMAVFGCAVCIFMQMLLNIAVVAGVVPATGIPLPFFSSGGSSMIVTLCMCGLIINASYCDNESGEWFTQGKIQKGNNQFEELEIEMFK